MISLNNLPKTVSKSKKRIGRGYGSGVGGHTTVRGNKGMKARSKVSLTFDGTKIKKGWLKKLPFLRGKGRFKSATHTIVVSVGQLDKFKNNSKVNEEALVKKGFVSKKDLSQGIKVLGQGKLTKALTVLLACSKKAEEKIIKAGGKVEHE